MKSRGGVRSQDRRAPGWRFRAMSPSEINENPVQGEFFSADLPKRFVRESVQNSLDARLLGKDRQGVGPVRVRFFASGKERALDAERASGWLRGLRPHFGAVVDAENARGARKKELKARKELFDGPMPFLLVEDFGTTGLRGDIRANEPEAKGNDFWGLFRSVGISPKDKDAGGSWGLGKWVFPDASRLNAFVGVTRREGEDRLLLMGQAMLKLHKMGDKKYSHYGYFAAASEEPDDNWLPMPLDSRGRAGAFVQQAVDDFGLRGGDGAARAAGPGTSVVVLHPERELTDPAKLAWAVITQYFLPIVAGDLVVEISAPGARTRVVDANTISDEVHRCGNAPGKGEDDPAALMRAIELAKWGLAAERECVEASGKRKESALSPLEVQQVRRRYEKGERLAFRVTTKVGGVLARFRVFLEKDDDLSKGQDFFVRGHLHIPDMDFIEGFRARAVTYIPSRNPMAHLLRDAEGPAHERWSPTAPRLRKKAWPAAAERVREAQRAALRILQELAVRPEEKQRDAFADLFPSRKKGRAPKTTRPADVPDPGSDGGNGTEPGTSNLRARPISSGFALDPGPNGAATGGAWSVRMAYDVARGTTRTAFSRFAGGVKAGCPDFSLLTGELSVEHADCTYEVLSPNELRVHVDGPAFAFKVTGFDERDLLVEIARVGLDVEQGER